MPPDGCQRPSSARRRAGARHSRLRGQPFAAGYNAVTPGRGRQAIVFRERATAASEPPARLDELTASAPHVEWEVLVVSPDLKEQFRAEAADHGFEFFGVVDAERLAEVPFPPHRCLDVPDGFLAGAKSVIVLGMHVWDTMHNTVVTSVLPDGAIPFDDVRGRSTTISTTSSPRPAPTVSPRLYATPATRLRSPTSSMRRPPPRSPVMGWIGKQTLCITPIARPTRALVQRGHGRASALRRAVHRGPLRRLRAVRQGVPHGGHHPRSVARRGARQEGRLLEVHRAPGDARRAQQGVAEVGRTLLAAREPRVLSFATTPVRSAEKSTRGAWRPIRASLRDRRTEGGRLVPCRPP